MSSTESGTRSTFGSFIDDSPPLRVDAPASNGTYLELTPPDLSVKIIIKAYGNIQVTWATSSSVATQNVTDDKSHLLSSGESLSLVCAGATNNIYVCSQTTSAVTDGVSYHFERQD